MLGKKMQWRKATSSPHTWCIWAKGLPTVNTPYIHHLMSHCRTETIKLMRSKKSYFWRAARLHVVFVLLVFVFFTASIYCKYDLMPFFACWAVLFIHFTKHITWIGSFQNDKCHKVLEKRPNTCRESAVWYSLTWHFIRCHPWVWPFLVCVVIKWCG